jgi:hypothetical protein
MPRKGLEPSRLAALVPEYNAANFIPHKELYRAAQEGLMWSLFYIQALGSYSIGVDTGVSLGSCFSAQPASGTHFD